MDDDQDLAELRALIGLHLNWQGRDCEVAEVLPDGPVVVLRCVDGERPVLADRHGDAGRRGPDLIEVPYSEFLAAE